MRYWNFLAVQNPWTEGPTHSDKVSDLYPLIHCVVEVHCRPFLCYRDLSCDF